MGPGLGLNPLNDDIIKEEVRVMGRGSHIEPTKNQATVQRFLRRKAKLNRGENMVMLQNLANVTGEGGGGEQN
jgi:hypothetical protein